MLDQSHAIGDNKEDDVLNIMLARECETPRIWPDDLVRDVPMIGQPRAEVVTEVMRALLVDWMIELADGTGLTTRTLEMGVHYLDDYTNARRGIIPRRLYQCVGAACLRMAAKFNEIDSACPKPDVIVDHAAKCFSTSQLKAAEWAVWKATGCASLATPTATDFLHTYAADTDTLRPEGRGASSGAFWRAKYLCELALLDSQAMGTSCRTALRPSTIAITAIALAQASYPADERAIIVSNLPGLLADCAPDDVRRCACMLSDSHRRARAADAYVQIKYGKSRFLGASSCGSFALISRVSLTTVSTDEMD